MRRFVAAIVVAVVLACNGHAQSNQNNQYRRNPNWAVLPAGVTWGEVTGVEPGPDGNIYVLHRCFAPDNSGCLNRTDPPILVFDRSGTLLRSFGQGMFVFPHGSTIDPDGNFWATDARGTDGKGHQVFKFSPQGALLMTLGKAGVAGEGPDVFNQPTDVVVSPNGDIFVADGHRETGNSRIVKFSKNGTFIKTWGKRGPGPGEFHEPHTIALDSRGRLFVGDRANNRIEIFDQDGRFLEEWKQFGRPSGMFITKDDTIYVADSGVGHECAELSDRPEEGHPHRQRGDGRVTGFIEDLESGTGDPSGAEGVGVDAVGNIYGAVVRRHMLEQHVKP